MIPGFDKFEAAFLPHRESFILIGGTAVQMVLGQYETAKGVANRARVTHDLDLLIVTERLSSEFKAAFHKFISSGEYTCFFNGERPHYYRFMSPKNSAYPSKIELLAHTLLDLPEVRYTPLDLDADESMSAMVLDEELYQYALSHCELKHGFNCLKSEALLVFKITAYLNLMEEYKQTNDARRKNDALKHRNDVFRVLEHIAPSVRAEIPQELNARIQAFLRDFDLGGANYHEWEAISQAIASPYLALDPTPLLLAYRRLFDLQDSKPIEANSSLRSLAHTWTEDPVADKAISEMRTIDKDLWKGL